MKGKTSNEVTVSTGCVDGGQLKNLKILVDLCLASRILYSKLRNANLTTVLVDYISPFFQKRINSTSGLWGQPCLYIYQLIYLSVHKDHNQYCALGHVGSCY